MQWQYGNPLLKHLVTMLKIIFAFIALLPLCFCRVDKKQSPATKTTAITTVPGTAAKDYAQCKKELALTMKKYAGKWAGMPKADKEKAFTKAVAENILPQWIGTPWNFYGTSETPGQGSIACGYFVTTALRDAGLELARIKLAQCASEQMIRTLVQPKYIQRFSNVPMDNFIAAIKQQGYGLYITGLDNHTGFLYHDGLDLYFIHATYLGTRNVQREKAATSAVLISSHYKITGKISADEKVLERWIRP
jgi:hypothetical protein